MAYQNNNGVPTEVTLSTNDTASLKAYVTAQQATGQPFVGFTNQAIADALNTPPKGGVPNPQPIPQITATSMPRTSVLSFLASAIVQALAGGTETAAALTMLQSIESSVQGNPLDPIPVTDINAFAASVATAGLDLTSQVTAAITSNGAWSANIPQSAWAVRALSVPSWLTADDIAAALAS